MKRSFEERLRPALDEALQSLDLVRGQAEGRSGAPEPGDIYVFRLRTRVALEWLVVRAHPDRPDQFFVLPLDSAPFVGTPDVALPSRLVHRPLTARCGQGTWVPARQFRDRLRVSALPAEAFRLVRAGLARLVQGDLDDDPRREQVDDDPNYHDWLSRVEQARLELEERSCRVPTVVPLRLFVAEPPPEIAARFEGTMAAKASEDLVRGLEQALNEADRPLLFYEVPEAGPGKLFLVADERGAHAFWVGSEANLPPLRVARTRGPSEKVKWRRHSKDGSDVFLAEPPCLWVKGRAVLRLGRSRARRIILEQ
jgi:hypothetical protein